MFFDPRCQGWGWVREQNFFRALADSRLQSLKKLGLNCGVVLQKLGEEIFSVTFRYRQIQSIRASLSFVGIGAMTRKHSFDKKIED